MDRVLSCLRKGGNALVTNGTGWVGMKMRLRGKRRREEGRRVGIHNDSINKKTLVRGGRMWTYRFWWALRNKSAMQMRMSVVRSPSPIERLNERANGSRKVNE